MSKTYGSAGQDEIQCFVRFFQGIAKSEGWAPPPGEIEKYIDRSVYFGLLTSTCSSNKLVGGLQLFLPDDTGHMPFHAVWPEVSGIGDGNGGGHITMLAIERESRAKDGGLFWLLAVEMWRCCVGLGIRELWLEATPRTMRCYQRLGWPLRIRGDLRMHWGEECYLCSLDVREVAGSLAERALRSPIYRSLIALAVAAPSEKV